MEKRPLRHSMRASHGGISPETHGAFRMTLSLWAGVMTDLRFFTAAPHGLMSASSRDSSQLTI